MSLVGPVVEYEASCWNTYKGGQLNALDCVKESC